MTNKLYKHAHDFRLAELGDVLIWLGDLPLFAFRARDGWIAVDRSGARETDSEQLAHHCRAAQNSFALLWNGQDRASETYADLINKNSQIG